MKRVFDGESEHVTPAFGSMIFRPNLVHARALFVLLFLLSSEDISRHSLLEHSQHQL